MQNYTLWMWVYYFNIFSRFLFFIWIHIFQKMEPRLFNAYMRQFKDKLIEKGRRDFWDEIVAGMYRRYNNLLSPLKYSLLFLYLKKYITLIENLFDGFLRNNEFDKIQTVHEWWLDGCLQSSCWLCELVGWLVWLMVFDATFNNISVISWQSVLFVEETRVPGEKHWPVASCWKTLSHNVVSSTSCHEQDSNSQF